MPYRTKDKTTIHIRLSHFLYNGLDVTSAKLNMSMSEVVRMAIYEWLKNNFTKKELDYFSDRDDMVEALIEGYREKGRAGPIEIGGYTDELEDGVKKGELEYYQDEEYEEKLKQVQKAHKERLIKLKKLYLEKFGANPTIAEQIKQVTNPEVLEKLRGVTNPEAVHQILMDPYDISKYTNKKEKKKEDDKKKS